MQQILPFAQDYSPGLCREFTGQNTG